MYNRKIFRFLCRLPVSCQLAFLFPVSPHPEEPSVDGSYQIVNVDAEVGIQSCVVINKDINGRHDDARQPQIDTGAILQPQVDNADKRTEYLQIIHFHICLFIRSLRRHYPDQILWVCSQPVMLGHPYCVNRR